MQVRSRSQFLLMVDLLNLVQNRVLDKGILSPYLFILCAESLSGLLQRAVENDSSLHGIQISPRAPSISHLFFADDSIISSQAIQGEAIMLKNTQNVYAQA